MGKIIFFFMNKDYLRQEYLVNNTEYYNLLGEVEDGEYTVWSSVDERCIIHNKISSLFERNPFFYRLIFDKGYEGLLKGTNNSDDYCVLGGLTRFDFDHSSSLKLRSDSGVVGGDSVTGILCFPYLDWDELLEWEGKVPCEYSVYVLNPHLVRYNGGAIGLFVTPKYYNGVYVALCNNLIIGLTGYPLFLTITDKEDVPRIKKIDLDLSRKGFVKELHARTEDNGLDKLISFWDEHYPIVEVEPFNKFFEYYEKVQPYNYYCTTLDSVWIVSSKPFFLKHKSNGDVLGRFYEFQFDYMFNVIDTDDGEYKLSESQADDLLYGEYDFYI